MLVFSPGSGPHSALDGALETGGSTTVLVVDQLEELFAPEVAPSVAEQFLDDLVTRLETAPVIVALRGDHVGSISAHPAFARQLEAGLHLVTPMTEDELRDVIERPAHSAGLRLEPGLVELLLSDVRGEPGGLPLLSFALAETWANRDGRMLTVDGYLATGGLRQAIATSAERLYEELPEHQRALARALFLRLVTSAPDGEAIRQRINPDSIVTDGEHRRVVDAFVRSRLVIAGDDGLEVAHEALVREWPRLRTWLDDDVEGQRILRHLAVTAEAWEPLGRPDSELYRGLRLGQAEEWRARSNPDLTPVEQAFLDASVGRERAEADAKAHRVRQQARQNRRLRVLLAAAAVLIVGVILAGLLAVRQRNRADSTGTLAEARRLGTQALVVDGYDKALLLAVEGRHLSNSPETRANLLSTIERSSDAVGVIRSDKGGFVDLAMTPDGKTLLVSTDRGAALSSYEVATRRRRAALQLEGFIFRAALSPNGRLAVVSDLTGDSNVASERRLHLVDPNSLDAIGSPLEVTTPSCAQRSNGCAATNLSFSRDDKLIAAVTDLDSNGDPPPAEALVWDVAKGGEPVFRYPFEADTGHRDVVFLPDSKTILVAGAHGTSVVDLATGREVRRIEGAYAPIALSPDGHRLAATLDPATAITMGLFDLATGQRTATLGGHSQRIARLAFSPDGTLLASGGDDRLVMVWDVAGGQRRAMFSGHTAAVQGLAFSPDGATLYSSSLDGSIYDWDLRRSATLVKQIPAGVVGSPPLDFRVDQMQLSPDAARVEFTSDDFDRFQLRECRDRPAQRAASDPDDGVFTTFSPDGQSLVTIFIDGSIRLFDRLTRALVASAEAGAVFGLSAFTPDGGQLTYVGSDTPFPEYSNFHLGVLDAATLEHVGQPMALDAFPSTLAVTRDGHHAVVVYSDLPDDPRNRVDLVDLDQRRVLRSTPVKDLQAATVSEVASDGRTVGLGSLDGRVALVDIASGTQRPVIEAHDGVVQRVACS